MQRPFRYQMVVWGFFAASLAAGGCRSEFKVDMRGSRAEILADQGAPQGASEQPVLDPDPNAAMPDAKPVGPPVDLAPSSSQVREPKKYFQSTEVVTITLEKSLFEDAVGYKILNTTKSGGGDSAGIVLVDQHGLPDGVVLTESDDVIQFQFLPGEDSPYENFFIGENTIEVQIDDGFDTHIVSIEIWFSNFDYFDLTLASFFDLKAVASVDGPAGYRFQGWVNRVSPSVVANDGSVLSTGFFNIITP